jgi:hypothetical protein
MGMFDPLESRPAREANYIVYFLDGAGKIRGAEWLAASDDGDALEQVRRLGVTCGCELWQRSRRVARIPSCE